MLFPLEELIKFEGNIYEITAAASRRAYQLSVVGSDNSEMKTDKPVSQAARQLFKNEIEYRVE